MRKYIFLCITLVLIFSLFGCTNNQDNDNINTDGEVANEKEVTNDEVYSLDLGDLNEFNPVPGLKLYGNDQLYMAGLFMENGSKLKIEVHSNDSFQDVINYYATTIGETVNLLNDLDFFVMDGNLVDYGYPVLYEFILDNSNVKTTITMNIDCNDVFWAKINEYWKENVIWYYENEHASYENQTLRYFYQEGIILSEINYRYEEAYFNEGLTNYKEMISIKTEQNNIDVNIEESNGMYTYIWDEDNVRATVECIENESLIAISQMVVIKD